MKKVRWLDSVCLNPEDQSRKSITAFSSGHQLHELGFWLHERSHYPRRKRIMSNFPREWSDMSNFVVHFTQGSHEDDGYSRFMGILSSASLIPENRFGIGKQLAPNGASQEAVCFSEIPPGEWGRLHNRRQTKYGIGFRKALLLRDGGGPIWYAWKESPHWSALRQMMVEGSNNPEAPIWKIAPFVDAPGQYGQRVYRFDWEREWRHIGQYNFEPEEVAFLMLPEEHHYAARQFFHNAVESNLGPGYDCPYVDPSWDRERILEAVC